MQPANPSKISDRGTIGRIETRHAPFGDAGKRPFRKRSVFRHLLGSVAVLAVFSVASAGAQDGTDEDTDQTSATELDTIVATDLVSETEGAVTVDAATLEREQATTLDQVLKSVPGADATLGPGNQFADINIRGNEGAGSVIVSVDGAEKNLVERKHGIDFNPIFFNPDFLEEVTVVKGPVSNVYGTGSVGGRVELRTVNPDDILMPGETYGGRLTAGAQSNGEGYSGSLIGAAQLHDMVKVLGGVSYRDTDGYDDADGNAVLNSGSEITGILTKLQFFPTEDIDAQINYSRTIVDYVGSSVYSKSNKRQDADFQNDVTDDSLSGIATFRATEDLTFDLDAFWSRTEHLETLIENRQGGGRNAVPGDFDNRIATSYGLTGYATYLTQTGAFDHQIATGGSYVDNNLDYTAQTGGDPSENAGTRKSFGVFVQDQINYDEWLEIIAGLRYEGFDTKSDDGVEISGGALLPKLTVAITPFAEDIQFYGTYARGMRSPRLNELQLDDTTTVPRGSQTTITTVLSNPNLEPEFADTFEAGIRYQRSGLVTPDDILRASIVYYNSQYQNRIEEVRISSDTVGNTTTNVDQIQNIGEAYIQGVELSASYDSGRFFIGGNAAFSNGKNRQTDEELNSVRPANGVVYAGLRFFEETLSMGAEAEMFAGKDEVGDNQGVFGNSTSGASLFNVFAVYKPTENFSLDARVNNIFNRQYRRFDQIDNGPGLNGKISMRVKF